MPNSIRTRREMLVAGLRAALLPLAAPVAEAHGDSAPSGTVAGAATTPPSSTDELDRLLDGTMEHLGAALQSGRVTPADVAERTAARLEALRPLNAIVEFDRQAFLAEAQRVQRDLARDAPLYGIPVTLKDNIDAVGYRTTAGAVALRDWRPSRDAEVTRRLRAAGACVAGKANMDELAAWGTTHNGVYGRTGNPYAPARHVGGSSGGSAVVVATRTVPAALGTDTAGSVRDPAAYCGVVGFRPTHGRVPSQGVVPLARRRDSIGPFARSVADVALLDAVTSGDRTPVTPPPLRGLRIGVPKIPFQRDLQPDVERAFHATLERLSAAGVVLVEGEIDGLEPLVERMSTITIGAATRADLEAYLREGGAPIPVDRIFEQIWHPAIREWLGAFASPTAAEQAEFRSAWDGTFVELQRRVAAFFSDRQLAAIAFPCVPITAAIEIPRTSDLVIDGRRISNGVWRNVQNTTPASCWDGPAISVPIGLDRDGLPIGLELDGPLRSDRALLGVALSVERVLPATPPPRADAWRQAKTGPGARGESAGSLTA